jgi:hypothetical protein
MVATVRCRAPPPPRRIGLRTGGHLGGYPDAPSDAHRHYAQAQRSAWSPRKPTRPHVARQLDGLKALAHGEVPERRLEREGEGKGVCGGDRDDYADGGAGGTAAGPEPRTRERESREWSARRLGA